MKKFMLFAAALTVATALMAGDWYSGTVKLAAGATNGTADVVMAKQFGATAASLDRFTAAITDGAGTGAVYLVSLDHGLETAIANSGNLNSTTLYDVQPKRQFTSGIVQNYAVVTGNVVVTGSYINTVTNKENYMLRSVRVKVLQAAAADETTYTFGIFAK